MAVAKHFPGIGRTTLDSHLTLPELDTPESELAVTDFVPFEAAILAGVSGIMLSHIQYNALDSKSPASLSPVITSDLLRRRMGYDGLVMTDDLDMKAIKVPIDESVHRIIAADVDIALICHKGPDIEQAHRVFLSEIERSDTVREASLRSVGRVMALKRRFLGAE
jgi:beta-N-acetylhexosaminidase